MSFKLQRSLLARVVVILFLLCGMLAPGRMPQAAPALQTTPEPVVCAPNTGWMWAKGPSRPEIAQQAELALQEEGIASVVTASASGEQDSCGTFEALFTDFTVTLTDHSDYPLSQDAEAELSERILAALSELGEPQLGNVRIDFGSGALKSYSGTSSAPPAIAHTGAISEPSVRAGTPSVRNVFVLVYNPILSTGQDLGTYMGWPSYLESVQALLDLFPRVSHGQLQYTVVETQVVTDVWPVKIDGFRYTEQTYLQVVQQGAPPHLPDLADYNVILDDPRFDICGKLNRGEIDELWMYGAPWFGFYESRLVGPGAYWFNSPPMDGTHGCNKLLPIMGLTYEHGGTEGLHGFGHRAEATMTKVYGDWQENRTAHNWDRFGLVKAQSPAYPYSGCGSVHYPPNGTSDYDYGNPTAVPSNCEDFRNYPNLSDPLTVAQPVTCTAWNCSHPGYMAYWFDHLPSYAGCGPDGMANDWWSYFIDPALALSPSLGCAPASPGGETLRVSVDSAEGQAEGYSFHSSISADGRYVAFASGAENLVPGDTNGAYDVFVRDLQEGTTVRVSVDSSGAQGNDHSENPSISGDGRYVAFESDATNLVPGDTNQVSDIFVHDTQTGATTRVSVDSNGGQTEQLSMIPSISGDGRIVAFQSPATDLAPGDNGTYNIYVHDRQEGTTRRVSVGPNGALADAASDAPAISADGHYVTFFSYASNLVPGDTNDQTDVFVHDLRSGVTTRVSVASGGTQADRNSELATISADGRYIAFESEATNLATGDTNEVRDIFVHDRQTGTTQRVSMDPGNGEGNNYASNPSISGNGRFIAFGAESTNLVPGDTNRASDIFVHDLQTGITARVSLASNGEQGDEFSSYPAISADGRSVTFQSSATNLVPGDTNQNTDVFLHRREIAPPTEASLYLSLANGQTMGGIVSADEDILRFDGTDWGLFFDGSDVRVGTPDLVAFSLLDADTILMSFGSPVTVNGITATPQDILRFDATSLGSDTAGTFSLYFDGSDVGLNNPTNEKIDALAQLPDGRLLISTSGTPNLSGLTTGQDEDALAFTPTSLGETTRGTWSLYFDGSDAGLSDHNGEEIDALEVVEGKLYLSTWGSFSVNGLAGQDEDLFACAASSLGEETACEYSSPLLFDGSGWGLTGNNVDAFGLLASESVP